MHSGSELVETWIPDGGFKIDRRRVRTQDGGATVTECLVPKIEMRSILRHGPLRYLHLAHPTVIVCPDKG
jgi:hypothetical protein